MEYFRSRATSLGSWLHSLFRPVARSFALTFLPVSKTTVYTSLFFLLHYCQEQFCRYSLGTWTALTSMLHFLAMIDPITMVDPIPMVDLIPMVDPIPMVYSILMTYPIVNSWWTLYS